MGAAHGDEGLQERFARRVKYEREIRGLSQADLAKLLSESGFHTQPTTIAKIEARERDRPRTIRLDEAAAIAEVFDTTVDDLIGRPRKIDRQAAVERIPMAGATFLQGVASALAHFEQALEALNVDPNDLGRAADLSDRDLVNGISVGVVDQRAILMTLRRGKLAEAINAISEVTGEISGFATMDDDLVGARFLEAAGRAEGERSSKVVEDANSA